MSESARPIGLPRAGACADGQNRAGESMGDCLKLYVHRGGAPDCAAEDEACLIKCDEGPCP